MDGEGIIARPIGHDDLACALFGACAASTMVRVGLTCRAASQTLQDRTAARLWFEGRANDAAALLDDPSGEADRLRLAEQQLDISSEDRHCEWLHPRHSNGEWTFERVHLWAFPPVFGTVSFGFASDVLSACGEWQVEYAAAWLSRHPGLTVRVDGYARQEAPAFLGVPLAQARAARVRQRLLERLQSRGGRHEHWTTEEADDGVRPGGYSEGPDLDEVVAFYAARPVGTKVQAEGRWPNAFCEWSSSQRKALVESVPLDDEVPCSIAEITISGFSPTSRLAF